MRRLHTRCNQANATSSPNRSAVVSRGTSSKENASATALRSGKADSARSMKRRRGLARKVGKAGLRAGWFELTATRGWRAVSGLVFFHRREDFLNESMVGGCGFGDQGFRAVMKGKRGVGFPVGVGFLQGGGDEFAEGFLLLHRFVFGAAEEGADGIDADDRSIRLRSSA